MEASIARFRPQDRADVAQFYAATAPVPVWNAAASQVAVEQGRSMSENARALALVNMAISDAQASVFETKYHYNFWRPETAIRAGDADGNLLTRGDPDFMPFVLTPCFPSYASGHGSSSGAAREVLERIFGARHHFITLRNPAVAGVVLQYERLPADHPRHRRRARLRRNSLPLRPGGWREARTTGGRLRAPEHTAAQAWQGMTTV